jgi:hypothetical protein
MPGELHRWLKAKAAIEGRSLSAVIESAARVAYPDAPRGEAVPLVAEETARYEFRRSGRRAEPRGRNRGA